VQTQDELGQLEQLVEEPIRRWTLQQYSATLILDFQVGPVTQHFVSVVHLLLLLPIVSYISPPS
jgi:hypothetical protein